MVCRYLGLSFKFCSEIVTIEEPSGESQAENEDKSAAKNEKQSHFRSFPVT